MGEDLNDIRAAIGTLVNGQRAILDKLDDLGALAARSARLEGIMADAEAMLEQIPNALRSLASDPMIGTLVGPQLTELADRMESARDAHRAARSGPSAIEQG